MDRQRFKLITMLNAAAAYLGWRQHTQQIAPVEAPDHDEFHHPRHKHGVSGSPHTRKYRRRRNKRNETAFQSRKRNRQCK